MGSRRAASGDASAEFGAVEQLAVDHFFELLPAVGVGLGLHQYDGKVPDLSREGTGRWVAGARERLARLEGIPTKELPQARQVDRQLLRLLLEGPVFSLTEARDFDRNPMVYIGQVSVTAYLVRDYAPAAVRARAVVECLRGIPRVLQQGLARLDPELPRPFLQLSEAMAGGIPGHLEEADAFVRASAPDWAARMATARSAVAESVTGFMDRLRHDFAPKASDDFALGPERFQRLLWVREGIRTPFAEIREAGTLDLRKNQARLQAIVAAQRPAQTIPQALEALLKDHPSAAELLPRARAFVAETRAFVREKRLVTIPEPEGCRVEETPSYGRALSTASMSPPGPFEAQGEEGIYYVTPVDPTWSDRQAEEWLRSLNDGLLRNITVHEVYPGHYVQFLHFRRSAGSLARKVFLSDSFVEGWAHYTEQLAVENGIDGGSVRAEVAQLHDALLRDVRLLASIGLHTEGRDLEWATQLFETEAYFERLPAEREAIRGTFNPEYYCYTLGKLAILDARGRYLADRFGGSLEAFHDALLRLGCPPVGLLNELLAG